MQVICTSPYLQEKAQQWLDWTQCRFEAKGIVWVDPEVHDGVIPDALRKFPGEVFLVWKNLESSTGKMVTVAIKNVEIRYARRDSELARHDPDGTLEEDMFLLLWYWLWH